MYNTVEYPVFRFRDNLNIRRL